MKYRNEGPVTLVDGRQVSNYSEEWRHECEARAILDMSPLAARRAHLYGRLETKFGRTYRMGGIEQSRGEAVVRRLEATMTAIWKQRVAQAKADVRQAVNDNRATTTDAA